MAVGRTLGLNFMLVLLACSQLSLSSYVMHASSDVLDGSNCSSTPLHEAVRKGTEDDVEKAIEGGVDRYALDCQGKSAMHLAIELNNTDMILALAENDVDVNYQFSKGETVLFFGVRRGVVSIVETLISLGSNVNEVSSEGSTPLLEALITHKKEMIDLLMANKAIYSVRLPNGDTCLHLAAESGSVRLLLKLLEMNFSVDAQNNKLETPLNKAVSYDHPSAVNILARHGADLTHKTAAGETLVFQAVNSKTLKSLRALLESGADPNAPNLNEDWTPLLGAIVVNSREAADLLFEFGANVYKIDKGRRNLFHLAVNLNKPGLMPWLAEQGVDVNLKDPVGWTPLHSASYSNYLESAKVLVSLKASLYILDDSSRTPCKLAQTEEMRDIVCPK